MVLAILPKRQRPGHSARRPGGHDLWQRAQLLHCPTLGDPLGAEGDVNGLAQPIDQPLHHASDPREHRAAQDDELSIHQVLRHTLDGSHDRLRIRVEMLVDRRADDDDHAFRHADGARLRRGSESSGDKSPVEDLLGADLAVGHHTGGDQADSHFVGVVEGYPEAGIGQRQAQRQADMAAPPSTQTSCILGSPTLIR